MQNFEVDNTPKLIATDESHRPQVNLWAVTLVIPGNEKGSHTITLYYVLAENEACAIGQARCAAGWAIYSSKPQELLDRVRAYATKLEFIIQGWGSNKF